jgi:hypothetical protein
VNPGPDRWVIIAQLAVAFLLIVFGACLAAFAGLSGTNTAIPLAVIGAGAALLPGGASAAASARILQAMPSSVAPDLSEVRLAQETGKVGSAVSGTVTLTAPAPPGGFVVNLAVDSPGTVTLPSAVTVPAGKESELFTVTIEGPASAHKEITITATAGATSKTVTLSPS